jgi:hypothetical protein
MNVDTTSPDYLAGVAAGRQSFRLSVFAGFVGPNHALVKDLSLPTVAVLSSCGAIEFGVYRLLVLDSMPGFELEDEEDA